MSEIRVIRRAALWACVVAGCNGEAATSARAELLPAAQSAVTGPAAAATPDQGSAGEPPLSDTELDRLLDALEQEITSR